MYIFTNWTTYNTDCIARLHVAMYMPKSKKAKLVADSFSCDSDGNNTEYIIDIFNSEKEAQDFLNKINKGIIQGKTYLDLRKS